MPIVRTYGCPTCNHILEVTLTLEEWDSPPPSCPACAVRTQQQFVPPAIVGSHRARAVKVAEDIAEKDYNVADMKIEGYEGVRNKVRYRDQALAGVGGWVNPAGMLQQAVQAGRKDRLQHGSSLDVIKTMPDMIENSKRLSAKIW